ncbi:MAG: truncated hemoglobin [Oligoflexus sp.]
MSKSLYERVGEERLQLVITEFYLRAFNDPIIGHFFFHFDREHLTRQQIDFARAMLGGPNRYQGKALRVAHEVFAIRKPHFGRRQVIMREVLDDLAIEPDIADNWLEREEKLRPLIVK